MDLQDLKQKLLDTNLVIDNEYLEKYIKLLFQNITTEKEYGKTQKHHIFPKCLSKILNMPIDNTVLNLCYKDHILAHYYLIYATNNTQLKTANIHAFNHLLKFQGHWLDENILQDFLIKQQLIYEQTRALRSEHSRKINSGGCYVNNGLKSKHIKIEDLDSYLTAGWARGQIQRHTKTRGTVTINNGKIEKRIKPDLLDSFLTVGWCKGKIIGYKKSGKNNTNKIAVYSEKFNTEQRIDKEKLEEFLALNPSYKIGSKKRKQYKKIKINSKSGLASKGRIWITNGIDSKMIFPTDLDIYLNIGWKLGRNKK